MKNIDKWNYYMDILNKRADVFMDSITKTIPSVFYEVTPVGNIIECFVTARSYSHRMYFYTKNPTNKDIEKIKAYCDANEPLLEERAYFDYYYSWGSGRKASTAVKITDLMFNSKTKTVDKEKAEQIALEIKKQAEERKLFLQANGKDKNYNYAANGYTFLGWQNGWKSTKFDKDGNRCDQTGNPPSSFGYTEEDYPLYGKCRREKHRIIEVSHNSRGSENTVSCPICKIYWKYDCSD